MAGVQESAEEVPVLQVYSPADTARLIGLIDPGLLSHLEAGDVPEDTMANIADAGYLTENKIPDVRRFARRGARNMQDGGI